MRLFAAFHITEPIAKRRLLPIIGSSAIRKATYATIECLKTICNRFQLYFRQ